MSLQETGNLRLEFCNAYCLPLNSHTEASDIRKRSSPDCFEVEARDVEQPYPSGYCGDKSVEPWLLPETGTETIGHM